MLLKYTGDLPSLHMCGHLLIWRNGHGGNIYAALFQHNKLVRLTCAGSCHKPDKEVATSLQFELGASFCNLHRQRESATIPRLLDPIQLAGKPQGRLHTMYSMFWTGECSSQYLKSLYLTVPASVHMLFSLAACRTMRKASGIFFLQIHPSSVREESGGCRLGLENCCSNERRTHSEVAVTADWVLLPKTCLCSPRTNLVTENVSIAGQADTMTSKPIYQQALVQVRADLTDLH